jgi:penicillin-insensitive murein endopeptidase
MRRALLLLSLLILAAAAPQTPAPGPVRVIGGNGGGCIAGAVRLPDEAPGLQTIRLSHSAFWGHPDTIAALLRLGREAHEAGLPDLYMGDISNPRGGPLAGGHMTHQMGLDADVYLDLSPRAEMTNEQRDALAPPSMVRADGRAVDPDHWRAADATLLRLAAGLPGVDRILVNPAIKKQLCEDATGDRAWLRLIRPWYDHAGHMHIHFRCPAGQPECPRQAPPPQGDGCDASLQWWFDQLDQPPKAAAPLPKPPPAPEACQAILEGK